MTVYVPARDDMIPVFPVVKVSNEHPKANNFCKNFLELLESEKYRSILFSPSGSAWRLTGEEKEGKTMYNG